MMVRKLFGQTLAIGLLALNAQAEVFELPPAGNDVVGAVTTIQARADETLLDIARRHGLGYEDIVRANPSVDTWLPGEGTDVVLPSRYVLPPGKRAGVVLNLAEYRMYYFPPAKEGKKPLVMTYPMSIGRMDWETPLGRTSIVSKVKDPAWYVPQSVRDEHAADGDPLPRIVPAGPNNPLGAYALRLGLPGYLIHSTNRPAGVGMRVSHGCVRMYPEDIGFLFRQVGIGTKVRIINEPVKIGWDGDTLVMEVHPALQEAVSEAEDGKPSDGEDSDSEPESNSDSETDALMADQVGPDLAGDALPEPARDRLTELTERFVVATDSRPGELDWDTAEILLDRADGVPVEVGRSIKNAASSAAFD